MPYSNTCIQYDADQEADGRWVGGASKPYKGFRIYQTVRADEIIDETNIEERNDDYQEEHSEDIWCIECDSRETATIICDALNSGVIAIHPPKEVLNHGISCAQ